MSEVPWFWPGAALSFAFGLAFGDRVVRTLGTSRVIGIGLLVAVGLVIAATLTPGREALQSGALGGGSCDLTRLGPASLSDLSSLNEQSLNVLLFVPLGVAIGLLPGSRWKLLLVVGSVAAPVAIELFQMIVPSFDRACESADIVDNLTGLGLGLAAGVLVARQPSIGARAKPRPRSESR